MICKKKTSRILSLAMAIGLSSLLLLSSCASSRRLCPAYKTPYKVEPLPY